MKRFFLRLLAVNITAIFLFQPGIVLAEIGQKYGKNTSADKEKPAVFSATSSNCFEFVALSLLYLPKELKDELAGQCKKPANKAKTKDNSKEAISQKRVLKADFLTKTSFVSDYIYQTPYDPIYRRAEEKFGVPWQVLSVVHEVESGRSGNTYLSSYAGAVGPMQFLPSTFAVYGVDGNNDGIADISNVEDAIFSAANYLAANGGASGNLVNALFRYNQDYWYVNLVLYKAKSLGLNA